jgi:hypothetical protein
MIVERPVKKKGRDNRVNNGNINSSPTNMNAGAT